MSTDSNLISQEIEKIKKLQGNWVAFYKAVSDLQHAKPFDLLEEATVDGHSEMVCHLLKIPAVLEQADKDDNFILGIAAAHGHLKIVKRLLKIPPVFRKVNINENYILRAAIQNGQVEVVNCLLKIPDILEEITTFDLNEAIKSKNLTLVNRFLEIPSVFIHAPEARRDVLKTASEVGDMEIFCRILEIPHILENDVGHQNWALHQAVQYGHLEILRMLLGFPIVVSAIAADPYNFIYLSKAAFSGKLEAVNLLLEIPQVLANAASSNNEALMRASSAGSLSIVNRLLKIPAVFADAGARDNAPLRCAAVCGHAKIVKRLLKIPRVKENAAAESNSPFRFAAIHGRLDIIIQLLGIPSVLEAVAVEDNYALQGAAENGHHLVVNILLNIEAVRKYFVLKSKENLHLQKQNKKLLQKTKRMVNATTAYFYQKCRSLRAYFDSDYDPSPSIPTRQYVCPLRTAAERGHTTIAFRLCEVLFEYQVELPQDVLIQTGKTQQSILDFKARADRTRTEIENIVFPGQDLEKRIVNLILEYAKFPEEELCLEEDLSPKKDVGKEFLKKEVLAMEKKLCECVGVKLFSEFQDPLCVSPFRQYVAILKIAEQAKTNGEDFQYEQLNILMHKIWLEARLCDKAEVKSKAEFMKKSPEERLLILKELRSEAEDLEHFEAIQEIDELCKLALEADSTPMTMTKIEGLNAPF